MQISVHADVTQIKAMFRQFPGEVRAACVSALNRTAMNARTKVYKRIRERRLLTIPAATIKSMIKVYHASKYNLTASLSLSGRPIPLNQFRHRVGKRGISVNVVGEGMKGPITKYGNKAFTNPALGNGQAFFVRKSSKRLPIDKLFGPSLPSAITASGWDETTLKVDMQASWLRNIESQLSFRLRKFTSE